MKNPARILVACLIGSGLGAQSGAHCHSPNCDGHPNGYRFGSEWCAGAECEGYRDQSGYQNRLYCPVE